MNSLKLRSTVLEPTAMKVTKLLEKFERRLNSCQVDKASCEALLKVGVLGKIGNSAVEV